MKELKEEIKRSKTLMGIREGLNIPKVERGPERPEEMTLECTISLGGYTYSDLISALDEARRWIEQGYRSGGNGNEDSEYAFEVKGEEWFGSDNDNEDE